MPPGPRNGKIRVAHESKDKHTSIRKSPGLRILRAGAAIASKKLNSKVHARERRPVLRRNSSVCLCWTPPFAKQTDPNLIVDPSFIRRIDQSGFIGALYKK
jgi:hypothetical protein